MIEFLSGALAVLSARANEIIEELERVSEVPSPVIRQCQKVVSQTRQHLRLIDRHGKEVEGISHAVQNGLSVPSVEPLVKGYLKAYHDLRRQIDAVEEFFAGHITRFSSSDEFLTRTASAIWREANLPGDSPVAVASTSGYFCTLASLGIVFAPPNDVQRLLILPDLYHECGHLVHSGSTLLSDKPRFFAALPAYIHELEQQSRRYARPLPPDLTVSIYFKWLEYWAEEVACDTLAARLVGPAFGWCNLHLCIRHPKIFSSSKHPADAARTRHIFRVLRRCGWAQEVSDMERRWEQYVRTIGAQKPFNYDDYHPDELFIAVMEDVEASTSQLAEYKMGACAVADVLNEAWKRFLDDPLSYPAWEKSKVNEMGRVATFSADAKTAA
ncbi:MAG: hypothetical protein QOE96_3778 [Blastocatellia bacterium]|jgi:hypothetical protein|nr:hypothetical protein [Blastocatellia bacterium]